MKRLPANAKVIADGGRVTLVKPGPNGNAYQVLVATGRTIETLPARNLEHARELYEAAQILLKIDGTTLVTEELHKSLASDGADKFAGYDFRRER